YRPFIDHVLSSTVVLTMVHSISRKNPAPTNVRHTTCFRSKRMVILVLVWFSILRDNSMLVALEK
ncbi:hypothetical protein AX16_001911, partial [Volvariella volvacea WC 439]